MNKQESIFAPTHSITMPPSSHRDRPAIIRAINAQANEARRTTNASTSLRTRTPIVLRAPASHG
jgi:hypothetical protein